MLAGKREVPHTASNEQAFGATKPRRHAANRRGSAVAGKGSAAICEPPSLPAGGERDPRCTREIWARRWREVRDRRRPSPAGDPPPAVAADLTAVYKVNCRIAFPYPRLTNANAFIGLAAASVTRLSALRAGVPTGRSSTVPIEGRWQGPNLRGSELNA
jgi:hypothetical protein